MRDYNSNWTGGKVDDLSAMSWNLLAVPAAVLVVMAVLQAVSFGKFKDWLEGIRISWPAAVAVVIILAELLGALSLLRIPINGMLRFVGVSLAVLVTGFWFIENAYLVTSVYAGHIQNSGLFGKYLAQEPGWWTVLEVTFLLFWVVFGAELLKLVPSSRRS